MRARLHPRSQRGWRPAGRRCNTCCRRSLICSHRSRTGVQPRPQARAGSERSLPWSAGPALRSHSRAGLRAPWCRCDAMASEGVLAVDPPLVRTEPARWPEVRRQVREPPQGCRLRHHRLPCSKGSYKIGGSRVPELAKPRSCSSPTSSATGSLSPSSCPAGPRAAQPAGRHRRDRADLPLHRRTPQSPADDHRAHQRPAEALPDLRPGPLGTPELGHTPSRPITPRLTSKNAPPTSRSSESPASRTPQAAPCALKVHQLT